MPGLLDKICNIYPVYPGCWIFCRMKNIETEKTHQKPLSPGSKLLTYSYPSIPGSVTYINQFTIIGNENYNK